MQFEIRSTPHMSVSQMAQSLCSLDKATAASVVAISRTFEVTDRKDIKSISVDYWGCIDTQIHKLNWFDMSQDTRDGLVVRQVFDQAARLPVKHQFDLKQDDTFTIISVHGSVFVVCNQGCTAFIADDASSHERIAIHSNLDTIARRAPAEFFQGAHK